MRSVPIAMITLLLGLAPAGAGADESRVAVTFVQPERYTDPRASCVSREADTRALLAELQTYLTATATPRLAPGQRLEVTVTDIDMAGEFETWRGPGRCDTRIVKDVYPPRIDLSFRLLGADGAAVRGNRRQLRDASFLDGATPVTADHLRYEKALLRDWLQRELAGRTGS
jgi:Protein of unknown function (DUF3016)